MDKSVYAKSLADEADIFNESYKDLPLSLGKGRKRVDECGECWRNNTLCIMNLTSVESSVSGVSGPSLS